MEDIKTAVADTTGQDEAQESKPLTEVAETPVVKTDTSESETESSPVDEKADELVKDSEIDSLIEEEPVHKDGVQKRIDKLTAQLRSAEEERDRLKAERNTPDTKEIKRYTEDQLKKAFDKAFEDNDKDLMWEIQKEQMKYVKEDLRNEYLNEKKQLVESQKQAVKEWENVVNKYESLASPTEPEIYPGARNELNINDNNSLLKRVALKLFEENEKYRTPGGQELAVADALALILRKKRGSTTASGKEQLLERKLAKEKRKSSLGTGDSMTEETVSSKPLSDKERLDEVINERKKYRAERELGI